MAVRRKKVSRKSDEEEMVHTSKETGPGMLEKLTPVLLVASIFLAFAVGVLWQKVQNLEKGGSGTTTAGQVAAPSAPTDVSGKLTAEQVKNVPKVTDSDHIRGNKNAKVFLIEYSDLQCPYCEKFHPTGQQIVDQYGDKVAWVYRHFPLEQIHPYARDAAMASECVSHLSGNDTFWKFVDEVFSDQNTYLTDLQSAATKVGVNGSEFKACFDAKKYASVIDNDYQNGITAGVTGTPANFILNDKGEGWLIPGAIPFDQIKITIDQALQS